MSQAYDIVGDVHGMVRTLEALIAELGYACDGAGPWTHPEGRRMIFLGDLIDRGPDPLGCLELAETMVRDGAAAMILGNHELNAMHYMADPPLREHSEKNTGQFRRTLDQIRAAPERWERARVFLRECPTRLELDGGRLRVIHACWDPATVDRLPVRIDDDDLLGRTAKGGDLHDTVDNCLKGPEEPCEPFRDKDGHVRTERRIPWWSRYEGEPFVAFGHYWFPWKNSELTPATPGLLGPAGNAACLDYSAGKGGPLVALRYPERRFVQVSCRDL